MILLNEREYIFLEYLFYWLGVLYLFIGLFLLIVFDYEGGFAIDFLFIFFLCCILLSGFFRSKRLRFVEEMKEEIEKLKRGINGKNNS
ncbi:MAG: hypothetical protein BV457_01610 [Thermoplasmata archaeon M9B1D]|nr:MAG: hypothetical protein BV457_01610 [Thermoplasmata archaeon M9B1D]